MNGQLVDKLRKVKDLLVHDMQSVGINSQEIEMVREQLNRYINKVQRTGDTSFNSGNKDLDKLMNIIVNHLISDQTEGVIPQHLKRRAAGRRAGNYYYNNSWWNPWWNSWYYGYPGYWGGYYNMWYPYYYWRYPGYTGISYVGGRRKAGQANGNNVMNNLYNNGYVDKDGNLTAFGTHHLHKLVQNIPKTINRSNLQCDANGMCDYTMNFMSRDTNVQSGNVTCDESHLCTYTLHFKRMV